MTAASNASTRVPIALRIAAALATLAAGAVLAFVVALWGWRWFGPSPSPPPAAREPAAWAPSIAAARVFGGAPADRDAPGSPPPPAVTLQGDTRLLGVFAERDGGGYALFRIAGKGPVLVRAGAELADGVKLVAVRPDGVRLEDHGEPRELALRAPAAPAAAPATGAAKVAARSTCVLPSGYRGPVYRLNAELLTGLSAQPSNWHTLVTPSEGALVVREGNALAAALGLAAGDRLMQANGIALATIDDVVTAIVRPLLASQPVRVSGLHQGKPAEWVLVNAGACPV